MRILILLLILSSAISCGSPAASLPELDLMAHGLPIKLKAPEGSKVVMSDMGLMKDVTVTNGDSYALQIFSTDIISNNMDDIKQERLREVKNNPFFSKVVVDEAAGFIFEKVRPDSTKNYDFRHIRFQGDKQYIFQTSMIGSFSKEDVESMYDSVK